ncbi:ABC transporter substrate-binding protein [Amorphus sp. 3PC139-8]|uniref:ABC transporter substrate-binding protein n=1 Tax=Amorphus sp. 3PC139-8 TaxID=2735676 RepID=UPI00345CB797
MLKKWIAAGAVLSVLTSAAMAADDVSLRLNWQIQGVHAPFYLGLERGYYADEDIDLTIGEGRGGGAVAQSVGAGSDTFGVMDAATAMISISKGIPIRTVMSFMNQSTLAIIVRADSGIETIQDMKGKTLALTAGDSGTQLLPAVMSAAGLDEDSVRKVFVDPAGKLVSVLEKRADALTGSVDSQLIQMEENGVEGRAFSYNDLGVPLVALTIVANVDTIEEDPDLVRRFVAATRKSLEAAIEDPDAAVAAAVAVKPELDSELMSKQLAVALDHLESANTEGTPIGVASEEDWATTLQLLKQYLGLQTEMSTTDFYTNEFTQ